MDDQKEFEEAAKAVSDAFAHLTVVAIESSPSFYEAYRRLQLIIGSMQNAYLSCILEAALGKKGE